MQVRVQASNTNDWGDLSEMNVIGGKISTEPFVVSPPTRGIKTSTSALQINWIALEGNLTGGVPIDSYNLQWDRGTNNEDWFDLIGDGLNNPYTTQLSAYISADVFAGTLYKVRVRAHNVQGWSDWSQTLSIKSSDIPE